MQDAQEQDLQEGIWSVLQALDAEARGLVRQAFPDLDVREVGSSATIQYVRSICL